MQTGENEQDMRRILDMTRLFSILLLTLHLYFYCYQAFKEWMLTATIPDKILAAVAKTGLFNNFYQSKLMSLIFLLISLLGARGRKDDMINPSKVWTYTLLGLIIYFSSGFILTLSIPTETQALIYMIVTSVGYLLTLAGGTMLSRIFKVKLSNQNVFNKDNETFPQQEKRLENEYSINLPARYKDKNKIKDSWINFINPMRGLLVMGSPGSGKSYFIIQHIIKQHLEKGFSMLVYDFKYPDLSLITYNHYLKNRNKFSVSPAFYLINFDDLSRSSRCNPLDPIFMTDITDAVESARTIMLGLNRDWIRKQGDFWVESTISFLTAIIWFLRRFQDGKYCTLPHAIELMQVPYDRLFPVLGTEKEISTYINPFVSAHATHTTDQLEGQIGGAKIAIARLSAPSLYYALSGNEFTLDINNPKEPKILCIANNPQKKEVYGAVLSLYISRLTKQINKANQLKSSLIFDEFPTIYFNSIDSLIATARSNRVATTISVQDYSQLKSEYSRDQAEVIINIVGNVISGQVSGDTAKFLAERFGKILQQRESLSINSTETSVSRSMQLEMAIPASKIASLSSGEFVGMVSDNPDQEIELKTFHSKIVNNHEELAKERVSYKSIPMIREISQEEILSNYDQIKEDVQTVVITVMQKIINDPSLHYLVAKKGSQSSSAAGTASR